MVLMLNVLNNRYFCHSKIIEALEVLFKTLFFKVTNFQDNLSPLTLI